MSDEKDWADVFEVHPDAKEIYVVAGMPFINKISAQNHEVTTGEDMEIIARPTEKEEESEENKKSAPKKTTAKKAPAKETTTPK